MAARLLRMERSRLHGYDVGTPSDLGPALSSRKPAACPAFLGLGQLR